MDIHELASQLLADKRVHKVKIEVEVCAGPQGGPEEEEDDDESPAPEDPDPDEEEDDEDPEEEDDAMPKGLKAYKAK
jgi:ribosomal protein L12E/L44/L45/RPP1/RPP2